jgi:hypothetical protein
MINLKPNLAFLVIVILACYVFGVTSNSSIVISYSQTDNASHIAPLISPSHSSADIINNSNNDNKSQTKTAIIRTSPNNDNQQQQQQLNAPPSISLSIKITSHTQNQTVAANKPLKIFGISSDNANSNCAVYADWNDLEPMQKANASGPSVVNDYSNWTFTYTDKYHLITEGMNELTSKLDCGGSLVKYYTVNVTGVSGLLPPSLPPAPLSNNKNNDDDPSTGPPLPFSLPGSSNNNNNNNDDNDDDTSSDNDNGDSDDDDSGSNNEESTSADNEGDKEKGKDKKEKKKGPSGESKKGKGPKGNNK